MRVIGRLARRFGVVTQQTHPTGHPGGRPFTRQRSGDHDPLRLGYDKGPSLSYAGQLRRAPAGELHIDNDRLAIWLEAVHVNWTRTGNDRRASIIGCEVDRAGIVKRSEPGSEGV